MEDFIKIVVWIVVGLIYVISRSSKKKSRPVEQPSESEGSGPRPVSFEDLLKEIQSTRQATPPPAPEPYRPPVRKPVTPSYTDYDDDLEDEDKSQEDVTPIPGRDRVTQVYEEARQQAFQRPSLEETVKLQDTVVTFKQFKAYESEESSGLAGSYAKALQNPEDFRKAFILSEILQRKF